MEDSFFHRHRHLALWFYAIVFLFNSYQLVSHSFSWLRLSNAILLPIVICGMCWYAVGSPKNWWRLYLGTYVRADMDRHKDEYADAYAMMAAIDEWMVATSVKTWHRIGVGNYQFLRKKDAVLFKLAWG